MRSSLLILFWLVTLGHGAEVRYRAVILDPLLETGADIGRVYINNSGMLAGVYRLPGQSGYSQAFLYTPQSGVERMALPFSGVVDVTGINERGQVALYGGTNPPLFAAYRYTPGVGYDVISPVGHQAETGGINNWGQVTGFREVEGRAYIYSDGEGLRELGSLYGGGSRGYDVNDAGWVTGKSDAWHAFLWRPEDGMVELGPGAGYAINAAGVVAGITVDESLRHLAAIWENGQMTVLGSFGNESDAADVNNLGQVVGISDSFTPFLWTAAEGMLNLNDLVEPYPGLGLLWATGINDRGQIVGGGMYDGHTVAFLLNPIPEPHPGLLAVFGICVLGAWRWWHARPGRR